MNKDTTSSTTNKESNVLVKNSQYRRHVNRVTVIDDFWLMFAGDEGLTGDARFPRCGM